MASRDTLAPLARGARRPGHHVGLRLSGLDRQHRGAHVAAILRGEVRVLNELRPVRLVVDRTFEEGGRDRPRARERTDRGASGKEGEAHLEGVGPRGALGRLTPDILRDRVPEEGRRARERHGAPEVAIVDEALALQMDRERGGVVAPLGPLKQRCQEAARPDRPVVRIEEGARGVGRGSPLKCGHVGGSDRTARAFAPHTAVSTCARQIDGPREAVVRPPEDHGDRRRRAAASEPRDHVRSTAGRPGRREQA